MANNVVKELRYNKTIRYTLWLTSRYSTLFPLYDIPYNIDFPKCRREIAASLNDFSNRCSKREHVEPNVLKEWKINIFNIIDDRISFTLS